MQFFQIFNMNKISLWKGNSYLPEDTLYTYWSYSGDKKPFPWRTPTNLHLGILCRHGPAISFFHHVPQSNRQSNRAVQKIKYIRTETAKMANIKTGSKQSATRTATKNLKKKKGIKNITRWNMIFKLIAHIKLLPHISLLLFPIWWIDLNAVRHREQHRYRYLEWMGINQKKFSMEKKINWMLYLTWK